MPRFTLTHEVRCTADAFWSLFFDRAFNDRLYKGALGFPAFEVTLQEETPQEIVRTVSAQPKMSVPAPVAKALGSNFRYVEEGTFDKATQVWRWSMIPGSMADKIRNEGTLRLEPAGAGVVTRVVEIVIEAKVFLLGGVIEEASEKQLRAAWEASAVFTNEWLRDHPAE